MGFNCTNCEGKVPHAINLLYSKLLGGGIESMAITEAFGGKIPFILNKILLSLYLKSVLKISTLLYLTEFRTGKTQLSHTLCGEDRTL